MTQQPAEHPNDSQYIIPALVLFGGIALLLVVLFSGRPSQRPGSAIALQPTTPPTVAASPKAAAQAVAAAAFDPAKVRAGEKTYQTVCSACHGFNARGISGLGKTLIGSKFVNDLKDDELVAFIIKGRDVRDRLNTTGVAMPARGGNPGLTDDDLNSVVVYIRSLNAKAPGVAGASGQAQPTASGGAAQATPTPQPTRVAVLPTLDPAAVTATPSIGTGGALFLNPGQVSYNQNCAGCHGLRGEGVPSIRTAPLTVSNMIANKDGFGLSNFLTRPQPPVLGEHPYRGGYPILSDQQIRELTIYLYTLPGK
jgi:disulfide bond formation protein DsbB